MIPLDAGLNGFRLFGDFYTMWRRMTPLIAFQLTIIATLTIMLVVDQVREPWIFRSTSDSVAQFLQEFGLSVIVPAIIMGMDKLCDRIITRILNSLAKKLVVIVPRFEDRVYQEAGEPQPSCTICVEDYLPGVVVQVLPAPFEPLFL